MRHPYPPLYPPQSCCSHRDHTVRMPLFGCELNYPPCQPCSLPCTQTVCLCNPNCPSECANVTLSVDPCGNLVISIQRDPPPLHIPPKRHRP